MKKMEDNKLVPVGIQIIMNAGDARELLTEALAHAKKFDFTKAYECLEQSHEKITLAHRAQTETIQAEIAGEEREELVLLFVHAQDTLMTVRSELKMAKEMIEMFEILAKRSN